VMEKQNKYIIFFVIAVLIVLGFLIYRANQTAVLEEEVVTEDIVTVERASPVEVASMFFDNFVLTAPPNMDENALGNALLYLSEEALSTLTQTEGQYTSGSLAQFVGVQDIPDVGYSASELTTIEDSAQVLMTMDYTSGTVLKLFRLSLIDGEWKIDSVEEYVETVNEEVITEEVVEEPIVEEVEEETEEVVTE
ncbi:hypothetical protein K0B04_04395, partial [Patescibacteria group bacterium]|nr:hypothetical protein [Patescibacteria group bacterium]